MTRIAIPEHQNRVSPVLDSSRNLLIVETTQDEDPLYHRENWCSVPPIVRASRLRELGIDVLLCGGISVWLSAQVEAQGIELIAWLAGDVQEVLTAYMKGQLPNPSLAMPGCCGQRQRRGRGFRMPEPFFAQWNGFKPQEGGVGPPGGGPVAGESIEYQGGGRRRRKRGRGPGFARDRRNG